jgi:hypothetical protein
MSTQSSSQLKSQSNIDCNDRMSLLACDRGDRSLSQTSSQLFAFANIVMVNLIDQLLQSRELIA